MKLREAMNPDVIDWQDNDTIEWDPSIKKPRQLKGKQPVQNSLRRIIAIIGILPRSAPGLSITDITSTIGKMGFSVDPRTVQRDMKLLREMLPSVKFIAEPASKRITYYYP